MFLPIYSNPALSVVLDKISRDSKEISYIPKNLYILVFLAAGSKNSIRKLISHRNLVELVIITQFSCF